jgi:hypothetical protein
VKKLSAILGLFLSVVAGVDAANRLEPLYHGNAALITDLGVGLWAWPLPMDYNGDGRIDLVIVCTDNRGRGWPLLSCPSPRYQMTPDFA